MTGDVVRLAHLHEEVRLARQLVHPHVCRVYDIGETDGQSFLSMEFIDGEDLSSLLKRIGRLPPDKGVEIASRTNFRIAPIVTQPPPNLHQLYSCLPAETSCRYSCCNLCYCALASALIGPLLQPVTGRRFRMEPGWQVPSVRREIL